MSGEQERERRSESKRESEGKNGSEREVFTGEMKVRKKYCGENESDRQ